MTLDDMKALTRQTLDFGVKRILKDGSIEAQFTLVLPDRLEVIPVPGDAINHPKIKDELSRIVRERARLGGAEAVVTLSDTFWSSLTSGKYAIVKKLNMNVSEAAAYGLCEKHEGVLAMLEHPGGALCLRQEYRRDPPDSRTVKLVGDTVPMEYGVGTGRFFNFFGRK